MSNTNNKQRALHSTEEGDDSNLKASRCTSDVSFNVPLAHKTVTSDTSNPVPHCCSYAAVDRDTEHCNNGIQGEYGVISLFGVSSVVRILKQNLNQAPTAIILAEKDEMLRSLVCAEFGYRSDEQWGYTIDGSACCYIRDVNSLLENDCHILRQVVAMYPNLKWFIIGGSPCQDLTFAGSSQGLLGFVGSQSRLFFVLLCTIRAMQVLVGPKSIRYLVENAGSMKLVHYVACCKLLGLPHEPLGRYIWELAQFTPYISRKRNFFRNFLDTEPV